MSAQVDVDPAALDRVVGLLDSVAQDEARGVGDLSVLGSDRVRIAIEEVRVLLDAGAGALADGMVDAARRTRSASTRWRAQDTGLGGRR